MMAIDIVMRFLHILSAVMLIGGALAWRFGLSGALAPLAADVRTKVDNAAAAALRPLMLAAMGGLLLSGLYTYMGRSNGAPPAWHAVIGIKFLGVLHIFAVGFLATGQNNAKRARQLTGIAISGVIVIGLGTALTFLVPSGL